MYDELYEEFYRIVRTNNLLSAKVKCIVPGGEVLRLPSGEYLAARGKEVIVHCEVEGGFGQAFTSFPKEFEGRVKDVLGFIYGDDWKRAIFFATLNAVLHKLNLIRGAVHCRESEPESCGEELVSYTLSRFGRVKVVHIGYQPGHVKALARSLGPERLYVTDLDPMNVGQIKFGVKILDGALNREVLGKVDVAYITGSTAVNGTLPELLELCELYGVKPVIYGVTGKGLAKLLKLEAFCPYGHDSLHS
ncbi:hypothetical protein KEJ27_01735 [Candidatus Bathyarchaeota archaeon]|nr:hypothetical protein [Candidatus Bathyarchaeota archaeon]MBS7618089.1 hypothetical protein [Candidatus Bathyarchaeota archaeon]